MYLLPRMYYLWIMKKWIDTKIGDKGTSKISESLKINTTLTQLNLSCNWNTTIDTKWIVIKNAVFNGLMKTNEQLTILEMKEQIR